MKKLLGKETVPASFAYCLKEGCPQAETCLRHLALAVISAEERCVRAVIPMLLSTDGYCKMYLSNCPVRMAYGWGRLYDNMPHGKAVKIKEQLLGGFGKTEYYRRGRMEKPITPAEQDYVRRVCRSHGVESEPEYERYEEHLMWSFQAEKL